jgi:hypothetical protein
MVGGGCELRTLHHSIISTPILALLAPKAVFPTAPSAGAQCQDDNASHPGGQDSDNPCRDDELFRFNMTAC